VAKVTMPQLGETVAEGTIGRWLKRPGERVVRGEALVEIVTDKVNAEVPSPFEGIVAELLVEEGAAVPTGVDIAVIDEEAGAASAEAPIEAPAPPTTPAVTPVLAARAAAATPAQPTSAAVVAVPTPAPAGPAAGPPPGDPDARMTPAVRRLLREHGLGPVDVVGSGLGGRITREDVLAVAEGRRTGGATPAAIARAAAAGSTPFGPAVPWVPGLDEALVPLTQMRRAIAAQMQRATQVPHAYLMVEIDMTSIVRLREALKEEFRAREGTPLSYVPFVVKATVEGLKRHPDLNAHWTERGLVRKRRMNVGVAVAVDEGLIVPVIRDADSLSIAGLNRAIADVAARARAGKLRLDDLQGGTVTVDNTGWFGSVMTMPILDIPQVLIVTMEAIVKRPVVRDTEDGEVIAVRSMMNMVAGFDHRATDGAQVGRFLRDVREWLEAVGPETPTH
jgi:pyruvate/2-oxoglutarate dehydrogenase complex dihydrolipoamide acyltransferase (E2) component